MLEFSPNPVDVATYQKQILFLVIITSGILGLLARRYFGGPSNGKSPKIDPLANYDQSAVEEGAMLQEFVEREITDGTARLAATRVSGPPDDGQQYVLGDMSLARAELARRREKNKRNRQRRKNRGKDN